jgi:hypothetical protein
MFKLRTNVQPYVSQITSADYSIGWEPYKYGRKRISLRLNAEMRTFVPLH